ncbi:DUF3549 family protein [Ferrimonas lipolytica]|uniref:DUF3549 family protein n=1 Tax=Ferrimonas lipolytica TaxID=2724191 RepID=A0A6H1UE90_9GAMM|nr:DUF3549 family protein [Ferrimonas lipolytica]QIZ77401.1 DUF3549 family protein [Ferrimonas lipolytica]
MLQKHYQHSAMTSINTLEQFLTLAGTQFRVFDMGRRVSPLDTNQFHQFENGEIAYPYPRSGHAWIGLLFWQPAGVKQHYVWFLKLPLDEQGKINPAARSQFLQLVVEALGQDPTVEISKEQHQRLASNPFVFTPSQEKMAVFNARVRVTLAQPASVHLQSVQDYFGGQLGWGNWQQLGLQGLADYCARLPKSQQTQLAKAITQLPSEPAAALINVAEHFDMPAAVNDAWHQRAQASSEELAKITALRGLAGCPELLTPALAKLLATPLSQDALIVIAARLWHGLDHANLMAWLEQLARFPGNLFNQLYMDLVAIPSLRPSVLAALRDPNRSQQLSVAIGHLMSALRG